MDLQKRYSLSSIAIFILFIVSMNHWIGWCDRSKYIFAITGLFLWWAYRRDGIKTCFTLRNIWPCIVAFGGYLVIDIGWTGNPFSFITNCFYYLFPLLLIICIKPSDKMIIMSNVTKWFSLSMVFALIVYFINIFYELPYLNVIEFSKVHYVYAPCKNYFFLVIPTHVIDTSQSFIRFQGPFVEPGHLGMMCAFLLFANKFDFSNRHNIVILFSLFVTFSLAGYVLALIGYILILYSNNKIRLRTILAFSAIILLFVVFGTIYNNGDNVINETITSRLEYDEEKGFSGNNRSSVFVMDYFVNMFDDLQTTLFGYDSTTLSLLEDEAGTGLVWFSVHYGIIGILFVLLFYLVMMSRAINKKYAHMFMLFLFAAFFQRNYPFWLSWIICFDYGVKINDYSWYSLVKQ